MKYVAFLPTVLQQWASPSAKGARPGHSGCFDDGTYSTGRHPIATQKAERRASSKSIPRNPTFEASDIQKKLVC
eukprot:3506694-Pleurochrysis_carterae.AAC.1